jgi:multidrug efflux pump subunit AcrA (membrane-fusion protein)
MRPRSARLRFKLTPSLSRANGEHGPADSRAMSRRAFLWTASGTLVGVALVITLVLTTGSKPPPPATATSTVARGTVTLQVSASGTVQAVQSRGLSFSMAGTVTEVDVNPGDVVKAGEVLARIDNTDAAAAVVTAQTRVSNASAAVTRAEQTAALPACPSQTARAGNGAGGVGGGAGGGTGGGSGGPRPSTSPSASHTPTPTPTASPTGSVTNQAAAFILGGPTTGSGTGGTAAGAQPTPTCTQAGKQTSTTDAVLSAQQQLNNADLALIQAQATLAGTTITAPIGGRVLSVGGKVGSSVSPGGTGFIVLGDISTLAISAQFSEADVGRLAVGQVASITLPDRDQPVAGSVSQIDPAGTVSNRLVRYGVEIAFNQVPADLLLGQSATVTVTTASVNDVLFVSSAAVTDVANGTGSVTIRTPQGDQTRSVKVGLSGDQYTEIDSGLSVGDVLVLPGASG